MSLMFMQKKTASVFLHQRFFHGSGWITQAALMIRNPGCGSQRLLLCRSHPAGRGPSLASLFPPQAAVGSAAVRIHPPSPEKISAKQKIQYPVRILDFLVGAGGFEPPKLKAADLQSVPIGHSGTRPYTVFCSRGLPVYITTRERVCQLLFTAFSGKSGCWTAWLSRGDGRSGGSSWRGGGHAGR